VRSDRSKHSADWWDNKGEPLPMPSVHLTVGLEAMWDDGLSSTWEAFFGAGPPFGEGQPNMWPLKGYYHALGKAVDSDIRYRRTVPKDALGAVPPQEALAAAALGGEKNSSVVVQVTGVARWRLHAKKLMHGIVDR